MKRLLVFLCVMVLSFGFAGVANATLWDRGGGLIYDTVLDITWLQDTNYAKTSGYWASLGNNTPQQGQMSWDEAMTWADQLVYGGYDGWRLPDAYNQDGSGPDYGYNVTNSEIGHMWYNNLLGSPHDKGYNPTAVDGNGNVLVFQDSETTDNTYWLGTEYNIDPANAWQFGLGNGKQGYNVKWSNGLGWAVHDGDIGTPVPEPTTMLLLGSGLIGLVGLRRKLRKKQSKTLL